MTVQISPTTLTKIFIGFSLHPELRVQLNQSNAWKQSRIIAGQNPIEALEVRFNNKDYLGFHVNGSRCSWSQLQKSQELLKAALLRYCPHLNADGYKIYLFSQLFIA